jgi:hypothetical protein
LADAPAVGLLVAASVYVVLAIAICIPPIAPWVTQQVTPHLKEVLLEPNLEFNIGALAAGVTMLAFIFPLTVSVISAALGDRSSSRVLLASFLETSHGDVLVRSTIGLCVIETVTLLAVTVAPERVRFLITVLNAAWLCGNLVLSGYFLAEARRFLTTDGRERAQRRFIVNRIVSPEMMSLLMRNVPFAPNAKRFRLVRAPSANSTGASVTFGRGMPDSSEQILMTSVEGLAVTDVRLGLLAVLFDRWVRASAGQPLEGGALVDGLLWECAALPGDKLRKPHIVAHQRYGGLPIQAWERPWIARVTIGAPRSKRKAAAPPSKDVIAELVGELAALVRTEDIILFEKQLLALVRMHKFLLTCFSNSLAGPDDLTSFGLLSESSWPGNSVVERLAEGYSLLFTAVCNNMERRSDYFRVCCSLAARLWRSARKTLSIDGCIPVLALQGRLLYILLGTPSRASLAIPPGILKRALIDFISGWDSAYREIVYELKDKSNWRRFGGVWPAVSRHLRDEALFVAYAASRNNGIALKWLVSASFWYWGDLDQHHEADFYWPEQLRVSTTPEIFTKDWQQVQQHFVLPNVEVDVTPATAASLARANAWCDEGTALATWIVQGLWVRTLSDTLLTHVSAREVLGFDVDGDRARQQETPFSSVRALFGSLFRIVSSGPKWFGSYRKEIGGLLGQFDQFGDPERISMRAYMSSGASDIDDMRRGIVLVLARMVRGPQALAFLPELVGLAARGRDDVERSLNQFLERLRADCDLGELPQHELDLWAWIRDEGDYRTLADAVAMVAAQLDAVRTANEADRQRRIREAPIDPERLGALEEAARQGTFTSETGPHPIWLFQRVRLAELDVPATERITARVAKGGVSQPLMAQLAVNEAEALNGAVRPIIAAHVSHGILESIDARHTVAARTPEEFWQLCVDFAARHP